MSQSYSLEQATKALGQNLLQNVEDAFYEQLRPRLDAIARQAAKNLAYSMRAYIQHTHNFDNFGQPQIKLVFNSEELKL
jgi:phage-related baseplate assembly protein